jgi:hypothetical protein
MPDPFDPVDPTVEERSSACEDAAAPGTANGAAEPSDLLEVLHTALCLQIDKVAADLSQQLDSRGIPSIILKGPSVANWLYEDGPVRVYSDADLLISPEHWLLARRILEELGYVRELGELAHPRMGSFDSEAWERGDHHIDLHCTLWGIEAPPPDVWSTLSRTAEPMHIGGRWLPVLAPSARALHLGLHVAQHGDPDAQPGTDLSRAIDQLPFSLWEQATELAHRLDAVPAFAAGLRLIPAGAALADRLGLPTTSSLEASLRFTRAPLALGFEHLAQTGGLGRKIRLLLSEIFPSPAFLRWWWPFASRGLVGLATAYVWRLVWVAAHAVPGYYAWRRARRAASGRLEDSAFPRTRGEPASKPHHEEDPVPAPAAASVSR